MNTPAPSAIDKNYKILTSADITKRRRVHIVNPASGANSKNRRYREAVYRAIDKDGGERMISENPGHLREIVADLFTKDPFAHAIIYGGDGSVYEAVNGIMDSGSNETATFSVIPSGSGNDFSKYANNSGILHKGNPIKIDLIKTTIDSKIRYSVNMTNFGFDCAVVAETYKLKKLPFFRGSSGYIAGVLKTLIAKKVTHAKIALSDCISIADGSDLPNFTLSQDFLLTACANAQYYGGGFKSAPLSSLNDGFIDILLVNDITRMRFVSLVKYYHDGTYMNSDGTVKDAFKDVIRYVRCKKMEVSGVREICLDGEIFQNTTGCPIEIEVAPKSVWFVPI